MSEMLERAARALEAAHIECARTSGNPIEGGEDYVAMARAVLMAVREPGREALLAVFNAADDYPEVGPSGIWEAGIDAILNEKQGGQIYRYPIEWKRGPFIKEGDQ